MQKGIRAATAWIALYVVLLGYILGPANAAFLYDSSSDNNRVTGPLIARDITAEDLTLDSVTINAGTTTLAPLTFTTGALLAAPANGAMEYDGTNFYLTSGGVRRIVTVAGSSSVDIDGGSIDATTIGSTTPAAGTFTNLTVNDDSTLGSNATDNVTINGGIQGTNALTFEGSADNGTTTTFAITNPTANNTITFPNASGTVLLSSNVGWNRTGTDVVLDTITDNVGVGIAVPQAKLDVAGEIKVGSTALACSAATIGAVRYNATLCQMEFCDGADFVEFGSKQVNPELDGFVTSTRYQGDLNGVAGANAICAQRANLGGKTGTYAAFVGTTSQNPRDLVANTDNVRVGLNVISTCTLWSDGQIDAFFNVDEFGNTIADGAGTVWTGANQDGTATANNCSNWDSLAGTGTTGSVNSTNAWMNSGGTTACNDATGLRLFCVEVEI